MRGPRGGLTGRVRAGDEVLGWTDERASQAGLVAVPDAQVTSKPAAVPWEVAGSLIDFDAVQRLGVHGEGTHSHPTAAALGELAALVADGSLEVPIARAYQLDDVRSAYEQLAARHTRGKIVLIP